MRVLIADGHAPARQSIRQLLSARYDVVGEAADWRLLAGMASSLRPDVLVIDFGLLPGDSLESLRASRQACPGARTVLLTGDTVCAVAEAALAAGADGVVFKCRAAEELPDALTAALEGRPFISPSCSSQA